MWYLPMNSHHVTITRAFRSCIAIAGVVPGDDDDGLAGIKSIVA